MPLNSNQEEGIFSVPATRKPDMDLPVRLFEHQRAWEAWLLKHFDSSAGLWLRLAKKSTKLRSVTYPEALEIALCYGWIDSQKQTFDEESFLQKFTPRGPRSIWSKSNRSKALQLIEMGRMQAAGLAAIEIARKNGRWGTAYDSHRTAVPPSDFKTALDKHPKAKAFYSALNSQNRYAILFRIQKARKDETRQKRIDQFIRMLEKHEKLYP